MSRYITRQKSWSGYIQEVIDKYNANMLILVVGDTGSGKSYASLKMSELISGLYGKDFKINNVAFSALEFMEIVQNKELKKGDAIIWDEVGVDLNARNWQSVTNKLVNALMMTFRNLNLVVFFTVPDASFVDSATRKLFHAIFEMGGIQKRKKKAKVIPKLIQINRGTGKEYRKYLKVVYKNGAVLKFKNLYLGLPSDILVKQYETKKSRYTQKLNQGIYDELKNAQEKNNPSKWVPIGKVCQATGIGNKTIRRKIKQGIYKGTKIGGKHYMEQESFQKLLSGAETR